jgi:hypothetical protein
MNKENDVISIQDLNFSRKLLDVSTLSSCNIEEAIFETVIKAHGAFVQDKNNSILFDLRLQSDKPFWGHSHPVIIKKSLETSIFESNLDTIPQTDTYTLNHLNIDSPSPENKIIIQQNLAFSNADKLNFVNSTMPYFIEIFSDFYVNLNEINLKHEYSELFKYIDTVLIKGERVLNIQRAITLRFPKLLVKGLLIIIDTDCTNLVSKAHSHGIYINSFNISDRKAYLSIPTSFTNKQLNDLLNRLELFFGELECL